MDDWQSRSEKSRDQQGRGENSRDWQGHGGAAVLLFLGILMGRGGFLTALAVSAASLPIAMMSGTWTAIAGLSAVVFLGGLAALINGGHLLPW